MFENSKSQNNGKYVNRIQNLPDNATTVLNRHDLLKRNKAEAIKLSGYRDNYSRQVKCNGRARKLRKASLPDGSHASYGSMSCYQSKSKFTEAEPSIHQLETTQFNKMTVLTKYLEKATESVIKRQLLMPSLDTSIMTPKKPFEPYSEQRFMSEKLTHGIKENHNVSKTPSKRSSKLKSKRRNSRLHMYNSVKSIVTYSSLFLAVPVSQKEIKSNPYECGQEQVSKMYINKLSTKSNSSCTALPFASSTTIQPFNVEDTPFQSQPRLPIPYDKTVTVYSVYDQRPNTPNKRKQICLGSGTSFSIQFYKSMGDGRPAFRDVPPYSRIDGRPAFRDIPPYSPIDGRPAFRDVPKYSRRDGRPAFRDGPYLRLPNNNMPVSMSRIGRDEDGCICECKFPHYGGYENTQTGSYGGGSFLKKYFRVLLTEQKRCLCGKKKEKRIVCPHNLCKRSFNVGCQCKCDSGGRNYLGNDAACQCKNKEKVEHRSDRDTFCRTRGTTCCVSKIPTQCSRCNSEGFNSPLPLIPPNRQEVNIGSKFSFQMGFFKRGIDEQPMYSQQNPNDCCYYNIPAYDNSCPRYMSHVGCGEPKSMSKISLNLRTCHNSKVQCKSSTMKSAGRARDNCCLTRFKSDETACCCPKITPKVCFSPKVSTCFVPCKSSKNKAVGPCCCASKPILFECTNSTKSIGVCCSTCSIPVCKEPKSCKTNFTLCRCEDKPILVECTNQKKSKGICCTRERSRFKKKSKFCKTKNIGCRCDSKPLVIQCINKQKSVGVCCSKCSIPESKGATKSTQICCCDKEPKLKVIISTLLKRESKRRDCCCVTSKKNEPKFSIVRPLVNFLKKRGRSCNKCNPDKSNEPSTKDAECGCKCQKGGFDYKKVLTYIVFNNEQKRETKAQKCKCKGDFDYKKAFGRLLLYDLVQKPLCCSSGTCAVQNSLPFSRSVGIGESDYRKPHRLHSTCSRASNGFEVKLKKLFGRIIKQETVTKIQYRQCNPCNQTEAAVQHNPTPGPTERAGKETICRNQASCAQSKPITVKDCENAAIACPAAETTDPNRKAFRLGSGINFSFELYKGAPPPKSCLPAVPSSPPCPPPPTLGQQTTNDVTPVCDNVCIQDPKQHSDSFTKKAFATLILKDKKHLASKITSTSTCQKCNKCVKVPVIKKGFAKLLLNDSKQTRGAPTCQKTNTLQPNLRLVKRRPGNPKGTPGGKPNCDPYVCLKRINQRKCCNAR